MARNFNELRQQLEEKPGALESLSRARAELDAEIAAFEAGLAELRRAQELTQSQLAKALDVSQAQVSRIENQTDLYLSTLQSYIEAMGGELQLIGVFDGGRVALSLGDVTRADSEDEEAAEADDEAKPAGPSTWEVAATLKYSGPPQDDQMIKLRSCILKRAHTAGDAVSLQRGHWLDDVDLGFQVSASSKDQADERAREILERALGKACLERVRWQGGVTVVGPAELAG